MILRKAINIVILLYLLGTAIMSCLAAEETVIASIKSWDIEAYNTALEGFNKALEDGGVKARLLNYNMKGSEEAGHEIAEKVISKKPDVVLTLGTRATRIAVQDIGAIPVVFSMVLEPVSSGFVKSMNSPGSNLTGASMNIPIKVQFEALKSVVPGLKRVGVLYNTEENGVIIDKASTISKGMGLELIAIAVHSEKEVPRTMSNLGRRIDALWMVADKIVFSPASRQFILIHTLDNKIPFMGISSHFVESGALLALSCDYADIGRQSGQLVLKMLNGAQPRDLAVTVPEKIRLTINLKTAKRIGLNIPLQIVDAADKVFK